MPKKPREPAVPKKFFSEKFHALPIKRKVAMRRQMKVRINRFYEEAEALQGEFANLHQLILLEKPTKPPGKIRPVEAKAKMAELKQRREKLMTNLVSITETFREYFIDFAPNTTQSGFIINPLAQKAHKAWRMLVYLPRIFKHAERDIEELGRKKG